MSWEEQWARNKGASLAHTHIHKPTLPRTTIPAQSRFGADPSVHYVSPQPVVMPQPSSGGSFGNAVLLLLAGFSVGTLFGEEWINKALGSRHPK
jgi:hypothetical protein